ncbi:hypothetical protein PVAP13_9KG400650 [Panicum virgatum]|uniref:Uncharacterized protein n=1 Tax=Panicum virgatum TaxID=38727 RepID=A0A8T0NRM2_PANVG|nr:hypothetical protein PVAP13_9KG400650 [Panicum virgatum]
MAACTRRPLGRRRQEQPATRAHDHAHMTPPPNVAVPLRACGPAAQRVAAGERHVVSSPRRRTTDVPGTEENLARQSSSRCLQKVTPGKNSQAPATETAPRPLPRSSVGVSTVLGFVRY